MDINPGEILANFVVASIVWFLMTQERKTLLERVAKVEEKYDKAIQQHQDDLRDWSGIDPRFNTWSRKSSPEGDTKRIVPNLTDEEIRKAEKLYND